MGHSTSRGLSPILKVRVCQLSLHTDRSRHSLFITSKDDFFPLNFMSLSLTIDFYEVATSDIPVSFSLLARGFKLRYDGFKLKQPGITFQIYSLST